jgi:hypothetical protein
MTQELEAAIEDFDSMRPRLQRRMRTKYVALLVISLQFAASVLLVHEAKLPAVIPAIAMQCIGVLCAVPGALRELATWTGSDDLSVYPELMLLPLCVVGAIPPLLWAILSALRRYRPSQERISRHGLAARLRRANLRSLPTSVDEIHRRSEIAASPSSSSDCDSDDADETARISASLRRLSINDPVSEPPSAQSVNA